VTDSAGQKLAYIYYAPLVDVVTLNNIVIERHDLARHLHVSPADATEGTNRY
jgi:hypothetical protein